MRIGSYGFHFPPFDQALASAVTAEEQGLDWVVYADQLSFSHPDVLWSREFTTMADVLSADAFLEPGVIAAGAAGRTSSLRFCLGPFDVVRRAPNVLAHTFASIDHATSGRCAFVISNGENKQMRPFGTSRRGVSDKLWDTAHILRLLFDSCEPVSYQGRVWSLDRARLALPSYGERPTPFWIAGGSDESLELAGSVADGWMALAPGHLDDDPGLFARRVATIREHAERAGRDPDSLAICLVMMALCLDDDHDLARLRDAPLVRWSALPATPTAATFTRWGFDHPISDDWSYARDCIPWQLSRDDVLKWCERVPPEALDRARFVGRPDQVLTRLEPYLADGLVTELIVGNIAPLCGLEYREAAASATGSLIQGLRGSAADTRKSRFSGFA